jgi:hypothetical protein
VGQFNKNFWSFLGRIFSSLDNAAKVADDLTGLAADASKDYRTETTELRSAARTKRRAELGLPPLEPTI